MRRKIGSVILAVSILSVLMPGTAMAVRAAEKPTTVTVREAPDQTRIDENANRDADRETDEEAGVILEGSGSETDPYRIKDAEQLRLFANMVNGVGGAADTGICAVLAQNIDLSGVCGADTGSWTPIGTKAHPYTGVFDGASFAVSGLYYNQSGASYVGLFGCNSGVIKNLGTAGDVAAGSYTGGVCGFNNGTITGCYSVASVKGDRYTGGVCGYNDGGSVNVCYNTGEVNGSKYVGGISGYNKNMVTDCYNTGTVYGSGTSVGGICGYNRKMVSNCYNTGEVSGKGTDYIGSICGYNHSESVFVNSYYLITGTEKGNYGIAMTRERLESGEVCWLLNGEKSEGIVWHQTCGAGFPVFGGKTVYQAQTYRESGNTKELVVWYTNDKKKSGLQTYTAAAEEGNSSEESSGSSEGSSEENSSETADGHVYQEPIWKWEGKDYKKATAVFICQDCGEKITREASIKEKTTKATCTADGKTVYTASAKMHGKIYQDTKTVKIEKTGHQPFDPIDEIEAKCEEPGFKTTCWQCPACKKYFKDLEGTVELAKKDVVAPALGHKYIYDASRWVWAPDYSSASVDFVCKVCNTPKNVKASIKSESSSTCTDAGEVTYTATVKDDNKQEYTVTMTVEGEKLPHKYSSKSPWKWDDTDDGFKVTAILVCDVCKTEHEEQVTERITSVKSGGKDCSLPGKITYTATVYYEGKKYTDQHVVVSEGVPHKYKDGPEWEWVESGNSFVVTAIFTCSVCETPDEVEAEKPVISAETEPTCSTPGKTTYTTTVQHDGTTWTGKKEVEVETLPHTYTNTNSREPKWVWEKSDDSFIVTVTFFCAVCEEPQEETVTDPIKSDPEEVSCEKTVEVTYTATINFNDTIYCNEHKEEVSADHDFTYFPDVEPTCVKAGNIEYWECGVCRRRFGDEDGLKEVTVTEIRPTGKHTLEYDEEDEGGKTYRCTVCDRKFTITDIDGMAVVQALDDGAFLIREKEEGDTPVSRSTEAEKSEEEAASDEGADGSALEDNQKDGEPLPADGQDGEDRQGEQKPQEEQGNQETQEGQAGQETQENQNEAAEQDGQLGNGSGEGIADEPEESAHYGLVYPAEEADKADPMILDAQEGSAVNLRAQSAANATVEKKQQQIERSLLICVVGLAAFTGMLLLLILRKKESQ